MTSFTKCPKCGYEHNPHPVASKFLALAPPEYQHWVNDLGMVGYDDQEPLFMVLKQECDEHTKITFQFFWDDDNIYLYNSDFDSDKPVSTGCFEEWLDIDKDPSKALWDGTQPWEELVTALNNLSQKVIEAREAGCNITERQRRLCLKTNLLN